MTDTRARSLLGWFRANRRAMPWRGPFPRDPYRVLIAEVMLQQTQVDRVAARYEEFLRAFPDLASLAAAPETQVLAAFSGLGYYRRARMLHTAARSIAARGSWPTTRAALASLAGIGPYTSAALAAFSFGGSDPVVDGNVARVTARFRGLRLPLGSVALTREAGGFAAGLHATAPTPEIWEALMELGARVCTPRAPECGACPIAPGCAAASSGEPGRFPLPRAKRPTEDRAWAALWVERWDSAVLLRRRSEAEIPLAGLWLPPLAETGNDVAAAAGLAGDAGLCGRPLLWGTTTHAITHRRITVSVYRLDDPVPSVGEAHDGYRWVGNEELRTIPTSTLLEKIRRVATGDRADVTALGGSSDGTT